jgi:hypothetical protein
LLFCVHCGDVEWLRSSKALSGKALVNVHVSNGWELSSELSPVHNHLPQAFVFNTPQHPRVLEPNLPSKRGHSFPPLSAQGQAISQGILVISGSLAPYYLSLHPETACHHGAQETPYLSHHWNTDRKLSINLNTKCE